MFKTRRFTNAHRTPRHLMASAGRPSSGPSVGRTQFEPLEARRLLATDIVFGSVEDLVSVTAPLAMTVGDFNGDGRNDIATASPEGGGSRVQTFLQGEDGSYTADQSFTVAAFPSQITAADINDDGDLDLSLGGLTSSDLSLVLGAGDGTFGAESLVTIGGPISEFIVADLDGMNGLDYAAITDARTRLRVSLNNGDGTFAAPTNPLTGAGLNGVVAADTTDAGSPNLFVTFTTADSIFALTNDGAGGFTPGGIISTDTNPEEVLAADLDGDGDTDLLTSNDLVGPADGFSALMNNGDGTFAAPATTEALIPIDQIAIADFNGDGIDDIAVVDLSFYRVKYYANNDGYVLDTALTIELPLGQTYDAMLFADLDDDDDIDTLGLSSAGNVLRWIENQQLATPDMADLVAEFDTGVSDSDNITRLNNAADATLQFDLSGLAEDATVEILAGDTVIASGATGTGETTLTLETNGTETLADGTYNVRVRYNVGGQDSPTSAPLVLTIDASDPVFTSDALTQAPLGPDYAYDAETDDEMAGVAYELITAPDGMTIDPMTGLVEWTPEVEDTGEYTITIRATDLAGNVTDQVYTLDVGCLLVLDDAVGHDIELGALGVATGDFNGDGVTDIATARVNGSLLISLGNGQGGFANVGESYQTGSSPQSIAVGDVTGDGILDVVTANFSVDTLSILPGEGDGTFGDTIAVNVGRSPRDVVLADVDGVNGLDMIVANSVDSDVSVLLNDGAGSFTRSDYGAGSGSQGVEVVDIDGDGVLDIVTVNTAAASVSVLVGAGDGTFGVPANTSVGAQPQDVAVLDLNNDGLLDVVTTNNNGGGRLAVLLGNANGAFDDPVTIATGIESPRIYAVDFDGDGPADIAILDPSAHQLVIYTTNDDGTLDDPYSKATGVVPTYLASGDFDGDGMTDAAVSTAGGDGLSVFLNLGVAAPAAPTAPDLPAEFDTGPSNSDGVTQLNGSADPLQFTVSDVTVGATVTLFVDGTAFTSMLAETTTVTFTLTDTTLADGRHYIAASEVLYCPTAQSDPTIIVVDSVAPTFTSQAGRITTAGEDYAYDAATNEEGNDGVIYVLPIAPAGMTVDTDTGEISWTPTEEQRGTHEVRLRVRDLAGNFTDQDFTVSVLGGTVDYALPDLGDDGVVQTLGKSHELFDPDSDRVRLDYSGTGDVIMGTLNGQVEYLVLVGDVNNLTIKVKQGPGGDGELHIGTLTGDGVDTLRAKELFIVGNPDLASDGVLGLGSAGKIDVGGLTGAASLEVQSTSGRGLDLRFRGETETTGSVSVDGPTTSFRTDEDFNAASVTLTGETTRLQAKGDWLVGQTMIGDAGALDDGELGDIRKLDFRADVGGEIDVVGHHVRTLDVRGNTLVDDDVVAALADFELTIAGDARNVRFRGELEGAVDVTGEVRNLKLDGPVKGSASFGDTRTTRVKGALEGDLTIGNGNKATFDEVLSGSFTATSLRNFVAKSDLTGNVSLTLEPMDPSDLAVRKFTVDGQTNGATITSRASIGDLLFRNQLQATDIIVGTADGFDINDGFPAEGADDVLADMEASIDRVTVLTEEFFATVDSNIIAAGLGDISLGQLFLSNGGTTFGLAARSIHKLDFETTLGEYEFEEDTAFTLDGLETVDFTSNQLADAPMPR
jgi:hypothetical protein